MRHPLGSAQQAREAIHTSIHGYQKEQSGEMFVWNYERQTAAHHILQVDPEGPQLTPGDFPEAEKNPESTLLGLSVPHFGHCKPVASSFIL